MTRRSPKAYLQSPQILRRSADVAVLMSAAIPASAGLFTIARSASAVDPPVMFDLWVGVALVAWINVAYWILRPKPEAAPGPKEPHAAQPLRLAVPAMLFTGFCIHVGYFELRQGVFWALVNGSAAVAVLSRLGRPPVQPLFVGAVGGLFTMMGAAVAMWGSLPPLEVLMLVAMGATSSASAAIGTHRLNDHGAADPWMGAHILTTSSWRDRPTPSATPRIDRPSARRIDLGTLPTIPPNRPHAAGAMPVPRARPPAPPAPAPRV